jgi:hypothetical protein
MNTKDVGPVSGDRRVPMGTRVQFDLPLGPTLVFNGIVFAYSGYFLYHTLKGVVTLKEVPVPDA